MITNANEFFFHSFNGKLQPNKDSQNNIAFCVMDFGPRQLGLQTITVSYEIFAWSHYKYFQFFGNCHKMNELRFWYPKYENLSVS